MYKKRITVVQSDNRTNHTPTNAILHSRILLLDY